MGLEFIARPANQAACTMRCPSCRNCQCKSRSKKTCSLPKHRQNSQFSAVHFAKVHSCSVQRTVVGRPHQCGERWEVRCSIVPGCTCRSLAGARGIRQLRCGDLATLTDQQICCSGGIRSSLGEGRSKSSDATFRRSMRKEGVTEFTLAVKGACARLGRRALVWPRALRQRGTRSA